MRILLVQESDWLRRGPHQQHHLLERMQQRGHEVRVIDYEIDWREYSHYEVFARTKRIRAYGKAEEESRIALIRPASIRAPLLCYASIPVFHTMQILKAIRAFKPDVIVGLGLVNSYIAAILAKLHGIPFVYYLIDSLHTLIPEEIFRPLGRFIEGRILKMANHVLAINKRLAEYAKKMGSEVEPEIITAGIDRERFNQDVDGASVRRELKIHDDDLVLFFMGWLYDFSGLREVVQIIKNTESKMKLVVLGRGELYDEIKEIAEYAPNKGIILIDWVRYDEVPKYVAAADICILPSHLNETMRDIVPIKLYEYLACGKPVIATRLPGVMKEFGAKSGIMYVERPIDVVRQASTICSDRKKYEALQNSALEYTKDLDWSIITDRFYEAMRNLVESKAGANGES